MSEIRARYEEDSSKVRLRHEQGTIEERGMYEYDTEAVRSR